VRRGFTLIEVLATLLVMSIVIPTVMQGIAIADRAADSARRRTEASGLAQMELATILATESWQNGSQSGDFNPDWPGYQWSSQVAAWPGDTVGAGLQEIDLTVSWTVGGRKSSLTLCSLAYARNVASASSSSSSTGTQ
jgi:prepilin-type N-terminal cleavage/methylation domain-containing protein